MLDEFWTNGSASPRGATSYPFRRPEYASLEPVIVSLRYTGCDMKTWFLGNGYVRIEWNTTFLTGQLGRKMRAGGLMMSCIQQEDTGEHDSGSDATEESDSEEDEEDDEHTGSEEEWSNESDSLYCRNSSNGSECGCERCLRTWDDMSESDLYDDRPEPPGMTQARVDYEFRRFITDGNRHRGISMRD